MVRIDNESPSFTFSKKGIDKRGKPVYNPRHLIVIF